MENLFIFDYYFAAADPKLSLTHEFSQNFSHFVEYGSGRNFTRFWNWEFLAQNETFHQDRHRNLIENILLPLFPRPYCKILQHIVYTVKVQPVLFQMLYMVALSGFHSRFLYKNKGSFEAFLRLKISYTEHIKLLGWRLITVPNGKKT